MWNGLTMDPEAKKLWVNELMSGKVTQGKGYLKSKWLDDFKYCCLGVFAEAKQVPAVESGQVFDFLFEGSRQSPKDCTTLPSDWFGKFFTFEPAEQVDDVYKDKDFVLARLKNDLIAMNDGNHPYDRQSFKEIGKWIDTHL